MNKQKTILSISIALLSIIFMFNFVSAGVLLKTPSSNTNHSSAISVVVTYINATDVGDPNSAATVFYYNASGNAGWTTVTCGSVTVNLTDYRCSIAITAIPDNASISLNVSLKGAQNITNQSNSSSISGGLTVDDTNPICTTGDALLQRNNIEIGTSNSLTCSCTDNIDSAPSTTRNLTKPGNTLVSITKSPYSTALSDTNKIGTYTFACGAIDYSLNGDTNTKTFRVDSDDDVTSTTPTIIDSSISSKRNIFIIGGLVLLVIVIGGIALAFGMSSGGKKRR